MLPFSAQKLKFAALWDKSTICEHRTDSRHQLGAVVQYPAVVK